MRSELWLLFLFILPAGLSAQTTQIKYLSGTGKDHTVQWDFFCTAGHNSGKWTKIPVPSCWELQGFGSYNYGHDKIKANEQGLYRYSFYAPNWLNKKVFVVFEGVMTDAEVKVNGKTAGPVHQGGFYRFKYDITNLLKPDSQNTLEVKVSKTSANASVNSAERNGDYWLYGGIFRPVYLEIVPATFIDRVAVNGKADGSLTVDAYTENIQASESVEAQVQKLNGEPVGKPFSVKADKSQEMNRLSTTIDNPLLWSSEFPNLYQVVVSIKSEETIIYQLRQRFGFRTVELRKHDGLYVNGAKILLKGSNRHSFWPETGRTLDHNIQLLDVKLMKQMNMNAVRMSHYPPDQDFLDVCDSLGLYVLDELTGWQANYDTITGHKLVKELMVRDVNHPSIIFWDNGNEGGFNRALDADYDTYDPQNRMVIHPWERFNGTNTKHYPDYNYVIKSVATDTDVFFPTEFMHGLYDGGAGAALDDFWSLMQKHPHGAGGFIWAFLDEAVIRTDKNGIYDTDGNHAPDGIVGPHREKEGSFYAIKEIWSPVYIDPQPIDKNFSGKIPIENRYSFTNLSQCSFRWKLVSFPSAADKSLAAKVNLTGEPLLLQLAPGKSGILDLHLPASWAINDALYLSAYGPDKKELFTWSWAIKQPKDFVKAQPEKTKGHIKIKETDSVFTVSCGSNKYVFNKNTGFIKEVIKPHAIVSLSGGPVLAGLNPRLDKFVFSEKNNRCTINADYTGDAKLHVEWTFAPGKLVKLNYKYSQQGDVDYMGISFNYPEEKITGMKWLGRGPYRVWKNRLKGQLFGVWHKNYNNAVTGENWIYPEFKGYHAEVNWVTIENKESPFTVYTADKNIFFQMLHPQREKDALSNNNVEPPFPAGDISFLNAISAIGTKFQPANVMGPQSQKFHADGETITGTLWFDFN